MSTHIEETVSDFMVSPLPSNADNNNSTYDDNFFGMIQQTNSVIATNSTFATTQEFEEIHDTPAKPLREIPSNVIYLIRNTKKVRTKNNGEEALILFLYAKDAIVPLVHWSSNLLTSELLKLKDMTNVYIRATGAKKSFNGRTYYSFQMIQKI